MLLARRQSHNCRPSCNICPRVHVHGQGIRGQDHLHVDDERMCGKAKETQKGERGKTCMMKCMKRLVCDAPGCLSHLAKLGLVSKLRGVAECPKEEGLFLQRIAGKYG